jgi:hypothetical protein
MCNEIILVFYFHVVYFSWACIEAIALKTWQDYLSRLDRNCDKEKPSPVQGLYCVPMDGDFSVDKF